MSHAEAQRRGGVRWTVKYESMRLSQAMAMVMISSQVSELEFDEFAGQLTQTIVLPNISWKTYNDLITDIGDNSSVRLAYNRGILTIKMPSKLHEICCNYSIRRFSSTTQH